MWKESAHRFANNILCRWIVWWCLVPLFLFVGTHFRIFVRKLFVHLRTVCATPQKLARPLRWTGQRKVVLKILRTRFFFTFVGSWCTGLCLSPLKRITRSPAGQAGTASRPSAGSTTPGGSACAFCATHGACKSFGSTTHHSLSIPWS